MGARNASELAMLIGDSAKLYGDSYWTNCPLHDDEHPSMSFKDKVYEENPYVHFKCHAGCSTHTQLKEHFQSIGYLDKSHKISPFTRDSDKTTRTSSKDIITQVKQTHTIPQQDIKKDGKVFTEIYEHLLSLMPNNAGVIQLMEGRGIQGYYTLKHQIKILPKDVRGIQKALEDRFGVTSLLECGLYRTTKNGNPYFSLVSHHLLFPYIIENKIANIQGRLIYPTYNNKPLSKYTNLSGILMPLYNEIAFQDAKAIGCNGRICVCEGVVDVLTVYETASVRELGHPVGVPGISNDKNLVDRLEGFEITIASDNDSSGIKFRNRIGSEYNKKYHEYPHTIVFKNGDKDLNACYIRENKPLVQQL